MVRALPVWSGRKEIEFIHAWDAWLLALERLSAEGSRTILAERLRLAGAERLLVEGDSPATDAVTVVLKNAEYCSAQGEFAQINAMIVAINSRMPPDPSVFRKRCNGDRMVLIGGLD